MGTGHLPAKPRKVMPMRRARPDFLQRAKQNRLPALLLAQSCRRMVMDPAPDQTVRLTALELHRHLRTVRQHPAQRGRRWALHSRLPKRARQLRLHNQKVMRWHRRHQMAWVLLQEVLQQTVMRSYLPQGAHCEAGEERV